MSRRISIGDLTVAAESLLESAGSSSDDAKAVARSLVWADVHGRYPQGVFRIPVLAQMLSSGIITSPAGMKAVAVTPAAMKLDAGNGFGQVAGERAMHEAIRMAKATGIGIVTVSRSNHYGAAGYFCDLAAGESCLGITMTNATPKVAPLGGRKPVMGTNPIAFGCPTSSGAPLLVDFSTGSIAGSTIRALTERGEQLPAGVALDKDGNPTTDPKALSEGTLLPAAGAKGFGLSLMVEILCGVLAGAGMSFEVGQLYTTWKRSENIGHLFMAINIGAFQAKEYFLSRVDTLIDEIKSVQKEEGVDEILYPGEIRSRFEKDAQINGIPLEEATVDKLLKFSRSLRVTVPQLEELAQVSKQ
jgi:LDH2 family malate/lactate/ureidoglycolate dehydrogenase